MPAAATSTALLAAAFFAATALALTAGTAEQGPNPDETATIRVADPAREIRIPAGACAEH